MIQDNFLIPGMGGDKVGKLLKPYIRDIPAYNSAIVELGTWCGSCTIHLIHAVLENKQRNIEIHGYDDFIIKGNEVDKAKKYGVNFRENQNILPVVRNWLEKPGVKLYLHQGDIVKKKWSGKPIYMYIDDALKYEENFIKALKIFSPSWVAGKTIIVLMDYFFYLKRPTDKALEFQKNFVESHNGVFEKQYENRKLGTGIFLYKGGLKL